MVMLDESVGDFVLDFNGGLVEAHTSSGLVFRYHVTLSAAAQGGVGDLDADGDLFDWAALMAVYGRIRPQLPFDLDFLPACSPVVTLRPGSKDGGGAAQRCPLRVPRTVRVVSPATSSGTWRWVAWVPKSDPAVCKGHATERTMR
jgi:hypothetical protein